MLEHESVLLKTTIDVLNIKKGGTYLDCTGGFGGHAAELLNQLDESGKLWICDYHRETAEKLTERFKSDKRVKVIRSRFSQLFDNLNFSFDGIMADLGISSMQLDDESLGIGFLVEDALLDMRIDSHLELSASEILKTYSQEELADLFFYYGGERASRKIAAAIVADRKKDTFYTTTTELRDLCSRVLGRFYYKKKIHPATKIFQALRIAVNKEIDELKTLLEIAPKNLNPAGRLAIIAFHSGEDKLVKHTFRALAQTEDYFLPIRKAVKPTKEEIADNPRARSARLRILERIEGSPS